MAKKIYEEETIRAIANKIRDRAEVETTYTTAEMPNGIDEVYGRGYGSGYSDGTQEGFDEGLYQGKHEIYDQVEPINAELEQTLYGTDTGGKSYYDEFWDAYQDNGNRGISPYQYSTPAWDESTFYPKYDLIARSNTYGCFYSFGVRDFVKRIKELGLVFDTSKATLIDVLFNGSYCTTIPYVSAASAKTAINTFRSCSYLVSIEGFEVHENLTYSDTFTGCSLLENLTIEGTIGQNGLNLQWSTKLSYDSIKSILDALSRTTTGLSITLSKAAVDKAFESSEGANDGSTSGQSEFVYYLHYEIPNWTVNLI